MLELGWIVFLCVSDQRFLLEWEMWKIIFVRCVIIEIRCCDGIGSACLWNFDSGWCFYGSFVFLLFILCKFRWIHVWLLNLVIFRLPWFRCVKLNRLLIVNYFWGSTCNLNIVYDRCLFVANLLLGERSVTWYEDMFGAI